MGVKRCLLLSGLLSISLAIPIFAENITCEPNLECPLPDVLEANSQSLYKVYSPIGENTVKFIEQAPRLSNLNGKTIAVVGGSFMASVTHPEIKRLILKSYPDAKVILLNEIGSAGPYPAPNVRRWQKDEFEKN